VSGAKFALVALAAASAAGCASGLRQLAPPGIYKYEDLEKGLPVNPTIAARVAEEAQEGGRRFPNLSEQPTETPEGVARPEREALKAALEGAAGDLTLAIESDRAAAETDRAEADLLELRSAVNAGAAIDAAAAAADKAAPPPVTDID